MRHTHYYNSPPRRDRAQQPARSRCSLKRPAYGNDDAVGLQSVVSADLAQDQTVVLVISGWNGGAGNFVLNIN